AKQVAFCKRKKPFSSGSALRGFGRIVLGEHLRIHPCALRFCEFLQHSTKLWDIPHAQLSKPSLSDVEQISPTSLQIRLASVCNTTENFTEIRWAKARNAVAMHL